MSMQPHANFKAYVPLAGSGQKLRELLKKHGNMKNVDIQIKKWQTKMQGEGNRGKWVTKTQLMELHGYTKLPSCMIYTL